MKLLPCISCVILHGGIMHNILSRSQLDEWRHFEDTLDNLAIENQKLNDYYECLIECDALGQHICKSICKRILM